MTKLSLVRDTPDEPPYFKHMGDVILKDGMTFLDAEQYIWDQMDDAAEEQDWSTYNGLIRDYNMLEDNYL